MLSSLSATQRDAHFREARNSLRYVLNPDVVTSFLLGKVGVYTLDMWRVYYLEWEEAGGQPSGYDREKVLISDHLFSQLMTETVQQAKQEARGAAVDPTAVGGYLYEKFGVYDFEYWVDHTRDWLNRLESGSSALASLTDPRYEEETHVATRIAKGPRRLDHPPHWSARNPGPRKRRKIKETLAFPPELDGPDFGRYTDRDSESDGSPSRSSSSSPSSSSSDVLAIDPPSQKRRAPSFISLVSSTPSPQPPGPGRVISDTEIKSILEKMLPRVVTGEMTVSMMVERCIRQAPGTTTLLWLRQWGDFLLERGSFRVLRGSRDE